MSYNNPYYPAPHAYVSYPPANWTAAATPPPTSGPPASGGGSAIQFGSLHPGQVEALQYGAQPMYPYPYAVPVMPPQHYYAAAPPPHVPAPQQGAPPHGMPAPRERSTPKGAYDSRGRSGRSGQHPHRERSVEPREGGGGSHHKGMRAETHGMPAQISRSGTPTSQQTQHREPPPVHHPPMSNAHPAAAAASQTGGTMAMAMHHPHPHHAATMHYYYGQYYPTSVVVPPPGEGQVSEQGQGYHAKANPRYHLESTSAPAQHVATHPMQPSEHSESQKATPTAVGKKRLEFVNPNTHVPVHFPKTHQAEKSTPTLTEPESPSQSHPSSKPSSPRAKHIEKTVADVIAGVKPERSSTKVVSGKVQKTELKMGDASAGRKTAARHQLQLTEPGRKIIDPSNGTHLPGSFRPSALKAAEAPAVASKSNKQTSSISSEVLRTVESVERKMEEKPPARAATADVKPAIVQPGAAEQEEKPRYGTLIFDSVPRKPIRPRETADVVIGTRFVAAVSEKPEAEKVEEPVPVPVQPTPVQKPPEEKVREEAESSKAEVQAEGNEQTELAAIETKRKVTSEPKIDTPSKNVYSPSVLQEFKEKNKEPLPDMGHGPWREGSTDLDSPLHRRGSGKIGSRSNSAQSLNRRNSNNGRASRQTKSEAEEVFHTSTRKRIYSYEFIMGIRMQFTEKPVFQESMQCMKDHEGPMRRSGSDRWPVKGGRGFEERGKTSLTRSSSGKDWQREQGRSANVVVGGRRVQRQFSGNQRGADDAKWGKTDISTLSPFAPNTAPGVGLHHTEHRYVVGDIQTDDPEEEKRQKTFTGLLNKLTPSNFARMYEKFKEVEITDPKTLKGLIDQIFDKALSETTFCPLYSDLCRLLSAEMPEFDEEGDRRKLTFRRLLLNKCQNEFEKGDAAVRAAEEAEKADDSTMSAEERQTRLLAAKKERLRSLGNMKFIGFLFKKGMLTERIIHNCIVDLLSEEENPKPEDIECLCQLLTTVGDLLKSQEDVLEAYFTRIKRLTKHPKLETRHKFMLLDLIEMKGRGWVERREKEGPKKIEEIHRDAQIEQMAQSSRNRGGTGGGFRGDYGGRSSRGSGWSKIGSSTQATRPMTSFNSHEEVKPLTKNLSLGRTASSDISLRPSNIGAPRTTVLPMTRSHSPSSIQPAQSIDETAETPKPPAMEEAVLQRKVKSFLGEYFELKDLEEALTSIEELFGQSAAKPEILKHVMLCALDIRHVDVNERLKPVSPLLKELLLRKLFMPTDAKRGLQLTMAALPDVADEFPKAPVLIAKLLGSLVSEGIIPLKPILDPVNGIILGAGRENLQSEEEDTPLVDCGFASEILIEILKQMKSEEQEGEPHVRDALHNEDADLLLFYPSYQRDDIDLSEILQFLD